MARHQSAFSLLEVMISLAVLAVVFGGVATNMATMEEVRRLAQNRQMMADLGKTVAYHLQTADWEKLVDLSYTAYTNDNIGFTIPELIDHGFMDETIRVSLGDIKESEIYVSINYLRLQGRTVAGVYAPGILDRDATVSALTLDAVSAGGDLETYAVANLKGLRYSESIGAYTDDDQIEALYDPVSFMVTVSWSEGAEGKPVFYTTGRNPRYE